MITYDVASDRTAMTAGPDTGPTPRPRLALVTDPHGRTRNEHLREVRRSLKMSQGDFAQAVQRAGRRVGMPNQCTKRLVQKWESGAHRGIRPRYAVALEVVTGRSIEQLGYAPDPVNGRFVVEPESATRTGLRDEELRVLTAIEVATALRVSTATVRRLINSGRLDAWRVGREYRIRYSELCRYLDESRASHRAS